jgi:DNA-binding response OmpR family regulator
VKWLLAATVVGFTEALMPGEKVLIVDDEPMIRWLLGEALRGWGYETAEAGSGAQALAALVTTQPAAVLLDINLPDSSGLELLGEIKQRQPQAAVVMVTAEAVFENAVAALRGGADDFVGKPVNLDELRFILQRVIAAKRQGTNPVVIGKPRVLIISDAAERIPHLQSAFYPHDVEVTSVVFPEEWSYAAGSHHDLALVDVGPELLEPLLKTMRTNNSHSEIPVLVEVGRVIEANNVAGVMPKYRAMACSHEEIVQLVRRRITSLTGRDEARQLL